METSTITIPVDRATADAYAAASPEQRRKLQLLLNLRLRDLTSSPLPPLTVLMDELAGKAANRGLTSDILESLLHGD